MRSIRVLGHKIIQTWDWLIATLHSIVLTVAGFFRDLKARFRARQRRRRHVDQGTERLLDIMLTTTGGGMEDSKIRRHLERVARKMAKASPTGVGGDQLLMGRAPASDTPPDTDSPRRPELVDVQIEDDGRSGFEFSDRAEQHRKAAAKHATSHQRHVSKTILGEKRDRKGTQKLELSRDELADFQRLFEDRDILPPPYRSDTRKVDLQNVRGFWEANPNAIEEVQLAARLPIVNNQIRTIIEHLITSRPQIQGPPDQVAIIREWFEVDMELGTNFEKGLDRFITDLVKQILYYGSAALVKQRTLSEKTGSYTDPVYKATRAPVWGYAIPDMATLEVFIDEYGRPRKWRQQPYLFPNGEAKEYQNRDVFLARLPTQNSSLYFWTPSYVMPALYAVEVLRGLHQTLESHTESIVDIRYYARVGNKDYLDGTVTGSMLKKTAHTINTTARNGTPVFPWTVELEKLDLDEYIEQLKTAKEIWEQEVRRGVGGSMLQDGVGDSATRNTSDALMEIEMRAAQALVPEIQRAFRWLVVDKLWEKGIKLDNLKSRESLVSLEFEEIDMHQQIRRETHYLQLWQSNGLTHGEFRKSIGRDEDPQLKDYYWIDLEAELEMELAELQPDKIGETKAVETEKRKTIQTKEGERRKTLRTQRSLEKEKRKTRSQMRPGGQPRPKRAKK